MPDDANACKLCSGPMPEDANVCQWCSGPTRIPDDGGACKWCSSSGSMPDDGDASTCCSGRGLNRPCSAECQASHLPTFKQQREPVVSRLLQAGGSFWQRKRAFGRCQWVDVFQVVLAGDASTVSRDASYGPRSTV
eukprot:575903-Rhodomonas_salina.1